MNADDWIYENTVHAFFLQNYRQYNIQWNASLLLSSIFLSFYSGPISILFLFVCFLFQSLQCCASYFQISSQCLEMQWINACPFWYTIWPRSFTKHSHTSNHKEFCKGRIIFGNEFGQIKYFHIQSSNSVNKLRVQFLTTHLRQGWEDHHLLLTRCSH